MVARGLDPTANGVISTSKTQQKMWSVLNKYPVPLHWEPWREGGPEWPELSTAVRPVCTRTAEHKHKWVKQHNNSIFFI